ncbi:MAG TPA: hypothetical protein VJ779_03250 [Acetobacteraceae bacterium]|nr:hypothetical protein [Acetobacteraceae bacterium]
MGSFNKAIGAGVSLAVCFVCIALSSVRAQTPDDDRIWTTIGSAGTLDKGDVTKVFLDHAAVQLGKPLAGPLISQSKTDTDTSIASNAAIPVQTESAVIRYNVVPVDGLFALPVAAPSARGVQLVLRYLEISGRVVAKLIEVDLATGVEAVRLTFDSNAFPAKINAYHVQQVGQCAPLRFDFKQKAYYIEATLTHSSIAAGSAAGIQMIKIGNAVCPG